MFLDLNNKPYDGDRQQRPDGSFDPELPERPSPDYQWQGDQWVLPAPLPDWGLLLNSLRSTDLFATAFGTSQSNALSLLLATLSSNAPADDPGRLADFDFAIMVIRLGLAADFTTEQIQHFNQLLASCHFPLMVNDGSARAANQVRTSQVSP